MKGNFVWTDADKTKAVFDPNIEGKFIIGHDPYITYSWWQKILIWLGLMKDKSGDSTVFFDKETGMSLPKDYVDMKNIKFPKTPDEAFDGSKFKSNTDENHSN